MCMPLRSSRYWKCTLLFYELLLLAYLMNALENRYVLSLHSIAR